MWKQGRPSQWLKSKYFSDDQYRIRVVQKSFLQSSILYAFDNPTPIKQATLTGEGLVQPNYNKVKGVFHEAVGVKMLQ